LDGNFDVVGVGFRSYIVNQDSSGSELEWVVNILDKDWKNAQHILDTKANK
jgi:hypothetical protein